MTSIRPYLNSITVTTYAEEVFQTSWFKGGFKTKCTTTSSLSPSVALKGRGVIIPLIDNWQHACQNNILLTKTSSFAWATDESFQVSILWLYNFYVIQPGCNCLSVSKTCLQSRMTKSSLNKSTQQMWVCSRTLDPTKAALCGTSCPDIQLSSHFLSLILCHTIWLRAQKATPEHLRCCPASIWPSEGCKGLLEGTDLLRRSIYGQNNLEQWFHFLTMFPHRLYLQYRWTRPV